MGARLGNAQALPAPSDEPSPAASRDAPTADSRASPPPDAPARATLPKRRVDARPAKVSPVEEKSTGTGTLAFRVRPWAEIFVDGRSVGISPVPPVDLPAGRHHVLLRNTDIGKERTITTSIARGETTTVRVDLLE